MTQNIKGQHKVWLYVESKKNIPFLFIFKPSLTRCKRMKENGEELHYDSLWIGRIEVQTSEVAQGCFYAFSNQYKTHKITKAKLTHRAFSGWHQ